MSDTPRTERFLKALETEKKDIWDAIKLITDWARGLEREAASLERHVVPEATDIVKVPRALLHRIQVLCGDLGVQVALHNLLAVGTEDQRPPQPRSEG